MSVEHKTLMVVLVLMLGLFALAGGYFYGVQRGYTLQQDSNEYIATIKKRTAPTLSPKPKNKQLSIPSKTPEFLRDIPSEIRLETEFRNIDKDIENLKKRKASLLDPATSLFGTIIEYIAPGHR